MMTVRTRYSYRLLDLFSFAVLVGGLGAACTESIPEPDELVATPGKQASAAAGSGASAPGNGTSSSAVNDGCNLPSCVRNVLTQCSPAGQCTMSASASGVNFCYGNGVKVLTSFSINGAMVSGMTTAKKPDGGICYSQESMPSATEVKAVYKNAAGGMLATSSYDIATQAWTVTCAGGSPVVVDIMACQAFAPANANGSAMGSGQSACASGSCM